ncbi:MAG: lysophospholipid acyltransferase family protein [Eubacteriales bacterium]|nr:lysophospholipid acyltransferase family protein [Eubacteriales bacterium]
MKYKFHRWLQAIAVPFIALAFHIYFGYRVIGRENIPAGGCVVCPNHVQLSDPPFAAIALGRRVPLRLMAKKELFQGNRFFAWLIGALGAFPVDREGTDISAIKTALGVVRGGDKLIIFPQGTRGAAEGETKKGAAMLAVKTRAPVLPMYITENKGFRCRATVVIGEPFLPEGKSKDYGAIADDILHRIYALKERI